MHAYYFFIWLQYFWWEIDPILSVYQKSRDLFKQETYLETLDQFHFYQFNQFNDHRSIWY